MSKLGYDETNFTDAIVDLGRCENETKRLNYELKLLEETIDHLQQKEVYLTNQIYVLENEIGIDTHIQHIKRNSKTLMDKAVATEAYRDAIIKSHRKKEKEKGYEDEYNFYKPWHYDTDDRWRADHTSVKGAFDNKWTEYIENRFAPGSVSYMMAKDRFEKKKNTGLGKTKKKKGKTKKKKEIRKKGNTKKQKNTK